MVIRAGEWERLFSFMGKNGTEVRWKVCVDGFFVDLHVRGLASGDLKGGLKVEFTQVTGILTSYSQMQEMPLTRQRRKVKYENYTWLEKT